MVTLVWEVAVIVDGEISDTVTVTVSDSSVLVKVWVVLPELNVGDDEDELGWEVEIASVTNSLEREIEPLVWTVVIVDKVDGNELITDSDAVTISVSSLVTVDGILSVVVWTIGVIDVVINCEVSLDDWVFRLVWYTVDSNSDTDGVSISSVVAVDKYVWLVLWTVVVAVGVTLNSVSDTVSKVKKTFIFKVFRLRWLQLSKKVY